MKNASSQTKAARIVPLILSGLLITAAVLFLLPLLGRTVYSPGAWWVFFTADGGGIVAPILAERFRNTALAFVAGGGLALGGLVLQTLFRNPLASPFTLGTASGASFGAVLAIAVSPLLWGKIGRRRRADPFSGPRTGYGVRNNSSGGSGG